MSKYPFFKKLTLDLTHRTTILGMYLEPSPTWIANARGLYSEGASVIGEASTSIAGCGSRSDVLAGGGSTEAGHY